MGRGILAIILIEFVILQTLLTKLCLKFWAFVAAEESATIVIENTTIKNTTQPLFYEEAACFKYEAKKTRELLELKVDLSFIKRKSTVRLVIYFSGS